MVDGKRCYWCELMSDKAINRCEPAPAQKLSKAPEANNTIPRGPLYYWHNLCYTMAAWGKPWQPGDSDYTSASLTSLLSKLEPAVLLYLAIGPALDHTEEGNPLFFKPNSIYHPTYTREKMVLFHCIWMLRMIKIDFPAPRMNIFVVLVMQGGR